MKVLLQGRALVCRAMWEYSTEGGVSEVYERWKDEDA
jgi:hypothetical protein